MAISPQLDDAVSLLQRKPLLEAQRIVSDDNEMRTFMQENNLVLTESDIMELRSIFR